MCGQCSRSCNVTCIAVRKLGTECDADGRMNPRRSMHEIDETGADVSTGACYLLTSITYEYILLSVERAYHPVRKIRFHWA